MQDSEPVEIRMWKTSWKVWNSTWKTGMSTWVLNFFHRVFNLWKKQGWYTKGKAAWMWKTFYLGQKDGCSACRGTTLTPCGAVRTAAQKFHGRKITILWQTPASYVILQDELSSPAALRHGKTCWMRHNGAGPEEPRHPAIETEGELHGRT